MEQPRDGVLGELNKRVVAESLIEKARSGRVTHYSETPPDDIPATRSAVCLVDLVLLYGAAVRKFGPLLRAAK